MPRVGSKQSIVWTPPRPSGRSSPSAGCRPTAGAPRRRRARRSGASRRPVDRCPLAAEVDRAPVPDPGDVAAARCSRAPTAASAGPRRGRPRRRRARPGSRPRDAGTRRPCRRRGARRRSGGRAGEDVEQLVLALAFEGDHAEDLARVEVERDVLQLGARRERARARRGCGARGPRTVRGRPAGPRRSGRPSTTSPSISSTIRSSEPSVTSTTPTVTPSRRTSPGRRRRRSRSAGGR